MPDTGQSSVDPQEIAHFARDSAHWWDESGPFAPLHRMGPLRLRYIRDRIRAHGLGTEDPLRALDGVKILDIGCGGGLVCEPLARLGAAVTGIDADAVAVGAAQAHAAGAGLEIDYRNKAAEDLLPGTAGAYDVVLALEIVEHVADLSGFIRSCAALCRPGGLLVLSTLNRTPQSFLAGIVAAEHILRWVPRGTHDWRKFLRPSELAAALRAGGVDVRDVTGYRPRLRAGGFEYCADKSVNYFMTAVKTKAAKATAGNHG